ncbi:MAG TPA: Vms1/Ankzf1 family peptidyl-tRNA hydrolase [Actinomycetota bacterium]|nr:Vms1/Ankzf1 family peptidyl-tRNA hydrolase [Actinomycetota bacterium]
MTELERGLLRKLADWDPGETPITSVYLTVDGRRFPRRVDYELRLDELLRRAREQAGGMGREAARSVERDVAAMSAFVREEFDRGDLRGLALFSSSAAGLWEAVPVPRPVHDRAVVAPQADLLPLEAVLETYRTTCAALVDYAGARVFVVELGRIAEVTDLHDDVPNRHDQGGWAQMRMQRHVDDHRSKHLKRVADDLFALSRRRPFEHLVLAGPAEAHRDLEGNLHDYLRQRVRASVTLQMGVSSAEVLSRVLEIEESLERDRERKAIDRLAHAAGANDHGVAGLEPTLEALAAGRVGELVVSISFSTPGWRCRSCGRLASSRGPCPTCGNSTDPVPDVVESAVASAYRSGASVESVVGDGLERFGGIGAILRF